MKLHLLENTIDQFISTQLSSDSIDWYFPHSLVYEFHAHWSPADPIHLKEVYDQCLRSEYSQRWWKRDQYHPKEIMLQLIEADSELACIAWKDFSNDAASLDGRLDRFNYYCHELLQMHRQKNKRAVETFHHQDAPILSLYLAGFLPEKYALYPGLSVFQSFCKAIGSPDIPVVDDLGRYIKIASIVFTYLQKNGQYEKLFQHRDPELHKVKCIPFQLSYELILYTGENNKRNAT